MVINDSDVTPVFVDVCGTVKVVLGAVKVGVLLLGR